MAKEVKCSIVAGTPGECSAYLASRLDRDSFIIAADAGYLHLENAGITPDLIIADFDSSSRPVTDAEIVSFPVEKSRSDTFNAVIWAAEHGFREIEIFNAVGGRFDHTWANILCLDYCRRHGISACLLDERHRISLITDEHTFRKEYDWFSLYAFLEDCKGVRIRGAYYTAGWYGRETLDLKQNEQFGLSNYITGQECTVAVTKGTLLLIEAND